MLVLNLINYALVGHGLQLIEVMILQRWQEVISIKNDNLNPLWTVFKSEYERFKVKKLAREHEKEQGEEQEEIDFWENVCLCQIFVFNQVLFFNHNFSLINWCLWTQV